MIDTFIFIPAYNVAETLEEVVNKIPASVRERSRCLIIDDGSKDNTAEVGKRLEEIPEWEGRIQLKSFEKNQGYGAVVKEGISEGLLAGAQFIACLHGDGQYPAEKLEEFIESLQSSGYALLQGSRHAVAGAARQGGMPLHKRIGGAVLTFLENLAFKHRMTDRHSGFLVYSKDFLKTVNLNKLSPSFDIDLELISLADKNGFSMGELPIPTRYAGEKSNLNVVSYGLRVLKQIFRRIF